jgi:hypothetical protein
MLFAPSWSHEESDVRRYEPRDLQLEAGAHVLEVALP